MFCSKCGTQLQDGAKFCANCGAPISSDEYMNYNTVNNQNYYEYSGPVVQPKKQKYPNIIGMIAGIGTILCAFLTFAKASVLGIEDTQTLMDIEDGKCFVVLGVLAIIFALLDMEILLMIAGIVNFSFAIYEVSDFDNKIYNSIIGNFVDKGAGYYLMIVALY